MNENKNLDILKRFAYLKNNDSFTFSYSAYLVFEKIEEVLSSFDLSFPDSIKQKLKEKIDHLKDNLPMVKNNQDKFNETKL